MKTNLTIRKNILSKFTKTLIFVTLFCLSFKANAQCAAGFTYTADTANNGQVYFTNTTTGTGPFNFYWTFGDGSSSNAVFPIYTYSSTGTYTVCLTVRDSINMLDSTMGCFNTYCAIISVIDSTIIHTGPTCNGFFTASDSSGYTHFQDLYISAGLNHLWDFGDGTTSTTAGPVTHLYTSPSTHIVCLTVYTSDSSCYNTYCDTVLAYSCHADYTYTPDAVGNGCTFTAIGTGTANIFNWDFGDGTSGTGPNPYHVYAANGWYPVTLTASSSLDTTCSDTYFDYVHMTGTCDATFYIVQDSTNLFNYWIYNSSTSSGTMTYLWDFGDGTTSTLEYPSHTYSASSPVLICLTVSNSLLGCTANYCDSINPGHASGVFTINVVSPLGIAEQTNIISSLDNYPNPFSDNTTINYSIKQDATVELSIVDLLGNKVAAIENGNKQAGIYSITWNSDGVAQGMYLLQLKVGNTVSTKKLIINK